MSIAIPNNSAMTRSPAWTVAVCVVAVIVATLLRMALTPLVGSSVPFITYFLAALLVVWYCGIGGAALHILLSAITGSYLFILPATPPGSTARVAVLGFVIAASGATFLVDLQRKTLRRVDREAARRKTAEDVERQQRLRFETTLASIGDAVVTTDSEGRIAFSNRVAQSLLGWSGHELTGKPLDDVFRIINETTRAKVDSPVAHVLREGTVVGLANHTVLISRDGSEIPIDDSAAPIVGEDGLIQGVVLVFRGIAERRGAERAAQLLSAIVQSSDDAIVSEDLNGVVTSWNQSAARVFGYSAGEMIGQPISTLMPADRKDEMLEILDRIKRGETVDNYATVRRTKSGELIDAAVTVSPVRDALGRIVGASKIARNITENKRLEQALRESEERYRATFDNAAVGIAHVDLDGRWLRFNYTVCAITGYPPWELKEKTFADITHPDDIEAYWVQARRVLAGETPTYTMENRYVRKNGSIVWAKLTVSLFRDKSGAPQHFISIIEDIGARKQAEERFYLAVEAASNGMVVTNEQGAIVLANGYAEKLFGYSREELLGRQVETLLPERFRAPQGRGQRDFLGEPQELPIGTARDLYGLRKDGSEFPMEVALNPTQTGDELLVLNSIVDISERKRAERERLELLAKEQALASEKALRELEAELARIVRALSVGELATSIAHEVNQPLAGVVTNAEAGLRWLDGDTPNVQEAKESLALIVRDGNRASAVIKRIREFLKKERTEMTILDLNETVQETISLARGELQKRQIALHVDSSVVLPKVRGDRIQLQQVILNLILNGVDAMAASANGPRELRVMSRQSPDGGVLIAVRDSGAGVSQEVMHRMFEPFYTTKNTGMGLGLSISRSIIEAHGGRIWAVSNEGPGLTVQFSVPAGNVVS